MTAGMNGAQVGAVVHVLIDGKPACGVHGKIATVPAHEAKYVTCRRCLAVLRKVGT